MLMVVKPMEGDDRNTEAERTGPQTGPVLSRASDTARQPAAKQQPAQAPPGRRRRNRVAVLARTLETDIIPRLLLAHRNSVTAAYIDAGPGTCLLYTSDAADDM
jgi:hypothetical protein